MISEAKSALENPSKKVVNVKSAEGDYIEELKKLKSLVDAGIISEEEFAIKKRQLLNI